MKKRRSMISAIILSGAVGLASTPGWSQEAPGETRQPDPNLTRPGRGELSAPGIHHLGTPELPKNDMQAVEEALKAKGYEVGLIDGVADDNLRKAIRSFQQDNGIPITGMVDQRTAAKLDVRISNSRGSQSGTPGSRSDAPMTPSGDDQTLPPSHLR
jgi:peptidoglycan hydrolase-like protein with peptidoglycan-binding domain